MWCREAFFHIYQHPVCMCFFLLHCAYNSAGTGCFAFSDNNKYGKEASRCKHHKRRLNMVRLFRKDWDKIRSREECGWQALVAADWDRHVDLCSMEDWEI